MPAVLKTLWQRFIARTKENNGQTVLIIAAVITSAALGSLSLYLKAQGNQHVVDHFQSTSIVQGQAMQAVLAYYGAIPPGGSAAPLSLPCPADPANPPAGTQSGTAATSCNSAGTNIGVLPWVTLGISREQALDAYGNYFTYVVSPDALKFCKTVTNGYNSADSQVSGKIVSPDPNSATSLEVRDANTAIKSGTQVPFAIIGHGPNGLGALSRSNVLTPAASSTAEKANCHKGGCSGVTTWTSLVNGPASGSQGSSPFDDQVFTPSTADLKKTCESLMPGGGKNGIIHDPFDKQTGTNQLASTGLSNVFYSATSTGVDYIADSSNPGNGVAEFSGTSSALITNVANYNLDPRVHALHISALWTPDVTNLGEGGISIATRATAGDLTSGTDDFNSNGKHGITVRFYDAPGIITASPGSNNHISIRNNGAALATSSAMYKLITGKSYNIESYDDGSYVWARITQSDDSSNTAVVGPYLANAANTGDTNADLDGVNQVVVVGGSNVNHYDNFAIDFGMLAAEFDGSHGYITGSNTGMTGNITLEAWIRARSLPTGSNIAVLMGSWNPADTTVGDNSFRFYLADHALALQLTGIKGTSTKIAPIYSIGYNLPLNEWHHVAASFNGVPTAGSLVSFYIDGVLTSVQSSAINSSGVITGSGGLTNFTVGAEGGTPADFFDGDISDVRVWNTYARATVNIANNYESRLALTGSVQDTSSCTPYCASLLLNWKLNNDPYNGININTGVSSGTNAAVSTGGSTNSSGTFSGTPRVAYVATTDQFFRPDADTVCPTVNGQSTVVPLYECDFRMTNLGLLSGQTGSIDLTSSTTASIPSFYTAVWGAGGGGFKLSTRTSAGGGGGYSSGILYKVGTLSVSGQTLHIFTGDSGSGSISNQVKGAGGGGATAIAMYPSTTIGLAAGGGGGASYSNRNGALNCNLTTGTATQCGLGGGGGGPYNPGGTVSAYETSQAPDALSSLCGGRGGDNSPGSTPPGDSASTVCDSGGEHPSATTGGSGTGGFSGGASLAGAGGAGDFTVAPAYAAGGGGGGISASDSSAGGGQAGGYDSSSSANGFGGGGGSGFADTNVTGLAGQAAPASASGIPGGAAAYAMVTITSGSHGDSIGINFANADISSFPYVGPVYTAGGGENSTDMAAGLAAAINADSTLQAASVTAVSSSNVVTIFQQSDVGNQTKISTVLSGANATLSPTSGLMNAARNFYYSPSKTTGTTNGPSNPGTGGSAGSAGIPGAAVLIW